MRKFMVIFLGILFSVVPAALHAQQQNAKVPEPAPHYYHLTFAVLELSEAGKSTNSRTYTTTISTSQNSFEKIRSGTRIPVRTNDKGEITYIDVGVDVDCRNAREVANQLALEITANISTLAPVDRNDGNPVVRQNGWTASVLVPIGKPTVILSSDNLESKGAMQIQLTAERID
jgi:hypothetical protein